MKAPVLQHHGSRELQSARLILRAITSDDREALFYNIAHDQRVLTYFIAPYTANLEDYAITGLIKLAQRPNGYCWAIVERKSNQLIGLILQQGGSDGSTIELGYALGTAYWNQGYATEALKLVIDYLFTSVGYHKVTAGAIIDNTASLKVMEKSGMTREGVRKDDLYYHGAYHDVIYYYIINKYI